MRNAPLFRGDRGIVQLVDLLEFAIEEANDGIAIMRFTDDPAVPIRIVYANATIERLSGFSRRQLLDPSNPFLRIQPQNRARYDRLLDEVRSGNAVRFEIALGGKDRATWTEIRWSPLQYEGKEVTHYVAVLREHPAELAHDGLCIVEIPAGEEAAPEVLYVNNAMCDMLQTSRDRIISEGLPDIFDGRSVARNATIERELLVHRKGARPRWVHFTASPARSEGKAERVAITCHYVDEPQRKNDSSAVLQSLLSGTPDFVITATAKPPSEGGPKITYANDSFAALVGLPADALPGAALVEFITRRNDKYESSRTFDVKSNDGNSWVKFAGHAVRDPDGRPTSWFFFGKEEPVSVYDVVRSYPLSLKLRHGNRRAADFERSLLERLFDDPQERDRIEAAWHALERRESIERLVFTGENDPRRWVTLEVRAIDATSLIAIEHELQPNAPRDAREDIATVLALSTEILRYKHLTARRDAFSEVLQREWGITAKFSRPNRLLELALRSKERDGYMVVPDGVLFERAVGVDLSWNTPLTTRRHTALRVFLETFAGYV